MLHNLVLLTMNVVSPTVDKVNEEEALLPVGRER
jgi:hypothetical protein